MPRGNAPKPRSAPRPTPPPTSRRRRIVHFVLFFISCVLVIDALVGDKGLMQAFRARAEHRALAAAIVTMRRENAELREQARRLREDPRAIEEVARRELGLIRPGEVVFIIKDVPAAASRPPSAR
jgi:cell division protein FtsB